MKVDGLTKLRACSAAVEWARGQKSRQVAWEACERGDWMLWLLGTCAGPDGSRKRKPLAMCAVDVAKLALPYAGKNRAVCLRVYRAVKAWHEGQASIEDVRFAADAAYAASAAASAAADASADAADAAYAASAAASAAADASAAATATYAAASAASRSNTLAKAADIVRKHYPKCPRF